ncbi:matrilysin [Nannospalax galili]|uniref:matrilysin n=1 Tax=Nannospalax galili TaxID=1026970 RepID=UPI00081A11BB|nr:matrilysin [Nannospalax galili]
MAAAQLTLLWAVCLLPGPLALPLPPDAANMSQLQRKQAQDYLEKFYSGDSKTKEISSLAAKLKEMQNFFGLPLTGKLNPHIMEIMQKPRCGVPDVLKYSLFPNKLKWLSKDITYRIVSYTSDLSRRTVDKIVEKAFSMWHEQIPLNFRRVRMGPADIIISFETKDHGDGSPFDGPGNAVAHAFGPGPGLGGDVHFDNDEYWTVSNEIGPERNNYG